MAKLIIDSIEQLRLWNGVNVHKYPFRNKIGISISLINLFFGELLFFEKYEEACDLRIDFVTCLVIFENIKVNIAIRKVDATLRRIALNKKQWMKKFKHFMDVYGEQENAIIIHIDNISNDEKTFYNQDDIWFS